MKKSLKNADIQAVRTWFIYILLVLLSACASSELQRKIANDEDQLVYFTNQSIRENLHQVHPMIQPFFWDNGPFNRLYGVTGATGTLSRYSPYGNEIQNVSPYMNFDWQSYQEFLTKIGGPLSEEGPYVMTTEFFQKMMSFYQLNPVTRVLSESLRAGNPLHVLGDSGNLSVLGLMGPGGMNGATGFVRDSEGRYRDNEGNIVRFIEVDTLDGRFNAPLTEFISLTDRGMTKSKDAFFAVEGHVTRDNSEIKLPFTNSRDQWISILLIGDYSLDDFELSLYGKGKSEPIAVTSHYAINNFIVIKSPKDMDFEVGIQLKSSGHIFQEKKFRLFVTGSSERAVSFEGPHQIPYSPHLLTRKVGKNVFQAAGNSCSQLAAGIITP